MNIVWRALYLPMDSAFLNALATSARAIDKIKPFHLTKQARMRGTQTHKEHRTYTKIKHGPALHPVCESLQAHGNTGLM